MRTSLPPLARPGEMVSIHAANIPAEGYEGVFVDAVEMEAPDESGNPLLRITLVTDDDVTDILGL